MIMCVTSVSFRPWAIAVGPRVEYRVTTFRIKPDGVQLVTEIKRKYNVN